MTATIGPSLAHQLANTPQEVKIPIRLYPSQNVELSTVEAILDPSLAYQTHIDEGCISLRATSPQIKQLADQGQIERLEFDALATDEPEEEQLPGGQPAERLREFIDQRFPDGIPYSPLPEDRSEEESKDEA